MPNFKKTVASLLAGLLIFGLTPLAQAEDIGDGDQTPEEAVELQENQNSEAEQQESVSNTTEGQITEDSEDKTESIEEISGEIETTQEPILSDENLEEDVEGVELLEMGEEESVRHDEDLLESETEKQLDEDEVENKASDGGETKEQEILESSEQKDSRGDSQISDSNEVGNESGEEFENKITFGELRLETGGEIESLGLINATFHSTSEGGNWNIYSTWQENSGKDCSVDDCYLPDADSVVEINGRVILKGNTTISELLINPEGILNKDNYTRTIIINGDVTNNGTIQEPNVEVSGNIENNGTWGSGGLTLFGVNARSITTTNPIENSVVIIADDFEIIGSPIFTSKIKFDDHTITLNSPDIITFGGVYDSSTGVVAGTGTLKLTGDLRGTTDISLGKIILEKDGIINFGNVTITGDVEIATGTTLRNYSYYYDSTLVINGSLINNGTIQDNSDYFQITHHLFLEISGDIQNYGIWDNGRTTLFGDSSRNITTANPIESAKVKVAGDFAIESSPVFTGPVEFGGHTITVETPNVVSFGGLYSDTNSLGSGIVVGTGILKLTGNLSNTANLEVNKVILEREGKIILYRDLTIIGNVEIASGTTIIDNGYTRTLIIDGDVVNGGTILSDYGFHLKISGNIENSGIWDNGGITLFGNEPRSITTTNPIENSVVTIADDFEIIGSPVFVSTLKLDGHAITINASDTVSFGGYYRYDIGGVVEGDGTLRFTGDMRGAVTLALNKLILEKAGTIIVGNMTIIGDVEIAEGTTIQNIDRYHDSSFTIEGDFINHGTIQDFPYLYTVSRLYPYIFGNIKNDGAWKNDRTYLACPEFTDASAYEFRITNSAISLDSAPIYSGKDNNFYRYYDDEEEDYIYIDSYIIRTDPSYWQYRVEFGDGSYSDWSGIYTINEAIDQGPTFSSLQQYKVDGETPLPESAESIGDAIVFSAQLSDEEDDRLQLQIELRDQESDFSGADDGGILKSEFAASGDSVGVLADHLEDGQYHWRARVVNEGGDRVSNWREFGVTGNTDFTVKAVPLYTQVYSKYPSELDTEKWYDEPYVDGKETDCGSKISQCACAITSMVMLGRYYGIDIGIDESDSNPLSINNWLKDNGGYTPNGSLIWSKSIEYLGYKESDQTMARLSHDYFNATSSDVIDDYIVSHKPAVAYSDTYGHYFVIDDKLTDTYAIRDPAWYNTKTLNDSRDIANKIQNYNNEFSKANLFTYLGTPKKIAASMEIMLASPAELLIIDPQGRRLGFDPVNDISYAEIPDAFYTLESGILSSEDPVDPNSIHKNKILYIPEPLDGDYDLEVTGTGEGDYTLSFLAYDQAGKSELTSKTGVITINADHKYNLDYDSENIVESEITPSDITAPTTDISTDGELGDNDWYISDVEVTLMATDDPEGVGVYQTEYSLDAGETWEVYAGAINFSEEGEYMLSYRSRDFVGNIEETQTKNLKIDKSAPSLELILPQAGDQFLHSGMLEIEYSADDEFSGLAEVALEINGENLSAEELDLFNYPLGENSLQILLKDNAGNSSEIKVQFEITADIDSTIADTERAYIEKMITSKRIRDQLIISLERIQKYIDRYGRRYPKIEDMFEKRLAQCQQSRNPERCEEKVQRSIQLYERFIYRLDKFKQRVTLRLYREILRRLDSYLRRRQISTVGYDILSADIRWLIDAIQKS